MMDAPETPPKRVELREWIAANHTLLSSTGVMIAVAVFCGNIGKGTTSAYLSTCFVALAVILGQEMFSTFPSRDIQSTRLYLFFWILAIALGNLMIYLTLLIYHTGGLLAVGLVLGVLFYAGASWVLRKTAFKERDRKFLRKTIELVATAVAIWVFIEMFLLTRPKLEHNFFAPDSTEANMGRSPHPPYTGRRIIVDRWTTSDSLPLQTPRRSH